MAPSLRTARGVHLAIFVVFAAAWVVVALAALGTMGALPGPLESAVALLTSCPYRALTGRPCPLCGATTAAVALLRGDLGASLALNPWALALAALAITQPPYRLLCALRPRLSWREELVVTLPGVATAAIVIALA